MWKTGEIEFEDCWEQAGPIQPDGIGEPTTLALYHTFREISTGKCYPICFVLDTVHFLAQVHAPSVQECVSLEMMTLRPNQPVRAVYMTALRIFCATAHHYLHRRLQYYGAIRGTTNKWLNLQRYFQMLRPADDIRAIKYFTAPVSGPSKARQDEYLRALSTLPLVEVIFGKFKTKRYKCRHPVCTYAGDRLFDGVEEKRTDVNIAVSMVVDAYEDRCDQFVLVSGDSDLVPAMSLIRARFPDKKLFVYVPHIPSLMSSRGFAVELRTSAHVHRDLPLNILPRAQFPANVPDGIGGFIRKPASW